jgi:hypothetical protein
MKVLIATPARGAQRLIVVTDVTARQGELGARDAPGGWQVAPADGSGWLRAFEVGSQQIDKRDEFFLGDFPVD